MIFFIKEMLSADSIPITPDLETTINHIADNVKFLYTLPKRYYHTWDHVKDCLKELEIVPNLNDLQKILIKAAIYYHDCIHGSELKSAQTAYIHLKALGINYHIIDTVYDLIMFTKHNRYAKSYISQVTMDIDLSIFGKEPEIFNQYEENIRKEYSQFSNYEYNEGRSEILNKFYHRAYIYHSEFFHDLYEEKARRNIRNLLKKLENS